MIEIMDSDLWHPPASTGVGVGVGCDAEYGWELDFDFCYVPDIMEENAINEKCCVEVLKHLIAKADAEIFDLEDDLAILKSQLTLAQHDGNGKLYEVWCAAFREKIASLKRSIHTLRKGSAPNNHALNADSGINHEPVERIHDIIIALLDHNFPTEKKKEYILLKADIEVLENTTAATTSMDLSMPDKEQIVDIENQPMIAKIREAKGLVIPDVRLSEKHVHNMLDSTFDRRERSKIQMPDCHEVLDNDVEGGSFALHGEKTANGSEAIPFQQNSEGTDELDPTLRTTMQWPSVKVEFDDHEPLIMFLNSQGSKRKKVQSNSSRPRNEVLEKGKQKKLLMKDTTASSKPSPTSKASGRRFGVARKSAEGKLPLRANGNSNQNSGLARNARSQIALSTEIKNPSSNSQTEETAEPAVSECTRNKLEKMNRLELWALAKLHGLKGYHKLKKRSLVDAIARHLGSSFVDSCTM